MRSAAQRISARFWFGKRDEFIFGLRFWGFGFRSSDPDFNLEERFYLKVNDSSVMVEWVFPKRRYFSKSSKIMEVCDTKLKVFKEICKIWVAQFCGNTILMYNTMFYNMTILCANTFRLVMIQ